MSRSLQRESPQVLLVRQRGACPIRNSVPLLGLKMERLVFQSREMRGCPQIHIGSIISRHIRIARIAYAQRLGFARIGGEDQ